MRMNIKIEVKYEFIVHEEADGFWAECVEFSGCKTQADNLMDLQVKVKEALELYLKGD
jgi:predicted RNase H-like HicB family nuclease